MALSKQQIFLVSGRLGSLGGKIPRGPVLNYVVCSVDDESVRILMDRETPDISIVSITSLAVLEDFAKKVKGVLAGSMEFPLLVDPELQMMATD
ncbi:MAG: hypothetical protein U1E13_07450 [Methylophilaceae bacterium]|nr:hypothetical protein [Methylophilaceae bacterium]